MDVEDVGEIELVTMKRPYRRHTAWVPAGVELGDVSSVDGGKAELSSIGEHPQEFQAAVPDEWGRDTGFVLAPGFAKEEEGLSHLVAHSQ